ncbi:MAG: hypothetical protein RBS07_09085 [Lentimicrobium sp.]|jgi:photosystem II stability/assembly factor-like uncharacterized protein|nr:hypothetical protein [Lentimicrobium sp.]
MKNTILIFALSLFSFASYCQDFWEVIPCDAGNNTGLFDMATTQQGIIFVAKYGTEGGVFRSDDNGLTWQIKNNGLLPKTIRGIAIKDNYTLYVSSDHGVHRTHDMGETWDWVYDGINQLEYNVIRFGYDSIILMGGGRENAILRSADDGETWNVVLNLFDYDYWEYITDIFFGPNNVIYACSEFTYNWSNNNPKVYYSTDLGKTWNVFWDPEIDCYLITIDFDNEGRLLVGGWTGIFRYDFNTTVWEHIWLNATVSDLLVVPDNRIFLASDPGGSGWGGVAVSEDGGNTYTTVLNDGLIFNEAVGFATDWYGRLLMHSWNYLYRSTDTIFTHIGCQPTTDHFLVSCYPNPFRSYTVFKSVQSSFVNVELYSITGEHLKTFEIPPLGEYFVDKEDLPQCIVVAKIKAGNIFQTIKLIHH